MIITCNHCKEQIFEDYDFCTHCSRNKTYYFCSKTCKYEWLLTTDEKTNFKKVEESRQYPRSTVNWPVTIQTFENIIMNGEIRNVSLGGAFIESRHTFPVDLVVSQSFFFPNFEIPIRSNSKIVWADSHGFGVQFEILDAEK